MILRLRGMRDRKPIDIGFVILWVMAVIYPLLVIPNPLGYFYLPRFILLAILAAAGLPLLIRNRSRMKFHPAFIPLGLFFIFSLISTLQAEHPITAWWGAFGIIPVDIINSTEGTVYVHTFRFTGFLTYVFCTVLFFLAYQNGTTHRIIKAMLVGACIVALTAIMQHFGFNLVPHESFREGAPSYGTIGQHNFLGTYMVFCLPAALILYLERGDIKWLFASGLLYAGLLVSVTRGVWIAFGIVLVFINVWYFKKGSSGKRIRAAAAAILLVTFILLPVKDGAILKRIISVPDNIVSGIQLKEEAGSMRMLIWKETAKIIPNHWAFGIGPDHLLYQGIYTGYEVADKAHNIYLEMEVSLGTFALGSYAAFLLLFMRSCRPRNNLIIHMMIAAYLLQGFFNIDVIMVMPLFFIVLGLGLTGVEKQNSQFSALPA